jgi:hypothetical protein
MEKTNMKNEETTNESNIKPPLPSKTKKFNDITLKYVEIDNEVLVSSIDLCTILNTRSPYSYELSDAQAINLFIYAKDKLKRVRKQFNKLLTILGVTEICNRANAPADIIRWLNTEIYGYEAIKLSPDTNANNNMDENKNPVIDINTNGNLNVELFYLYRDAFYKISNGDSFEKTAAFNLINAFEPHLETLIGNLIEK